MTKIALRTYNHEIESLIEQGRRLDEAVAHCRHILATFPKYLDTYRLLGKAYLEAKRHDQAVDIFQRVLVSAPDDFVSHVGMSIIADDQGKLDEAIWHMERAFEVQPSNAAIQAELQRLFGRRDGVEPPKIRLTRGALAHMYVQGELFTQAISEIRAVLATDSERMDMQVLLARAYFSNGQRAEAADICSAVLAASPYCLDANRLMAEILPGTQATDTAQDCRRRVLELDPYAEFAKGSISATDTVPDGAVTLERLEYVGAQVDAGAGTGFSLAPGLRTAEAAGAVPNWLAASAKPAAAVGTPAMPDHDQDLPDFLRGSGWREVPADSLGNSEPVPPADVAEIEPGTESDAIPGELPAWVRALAPNEEQESPATTAPDPGQNSWQSAGSRSADTQADAAGEPTEDTPDWLRELAKGAEPTKDPASPQRERQPVVPPLAAGPSDSPSSSAHGDNGLAWLEGLAEKHGARPEDLTTPPESRTETPPDWVERLGQDQDVTPEGWRAIDEGPVGPASKDAPSPEEQRPSAAGSTLDWLTGLADSDAFAGMEKPVEDDLAPLSVDAASKNDPAPAAQENLPDWLTSKPREIPTPTAAPATGREPSGEYESNPDLPTWLADLDGPQPSDAPAVPPEDSAPKMPEWLQPATQEPEPTGVASQWRPQEVDALPAEKPVLQPTEAGAMQPVAGTPLPAAAALPSSDALPSRTLPGVQAAAGEEASLRAAKAELARGNIAAALDMYAKLIRRGKSLTEIIRELRDALYRYPVEVPIWQALGDAYMRANHLQQALDAYTKAEELLR